MSPGQAREAAGRTHRAAAEANDSEALTLAVRVGLISYGVVHILVGWLALQLAFGDAEGSADNQGALQQLAETPLGRPLLWVLVVGFIALVVWKVIEAAVGHQEEDGAKRLGQRAADAGKAILYGSVGYSAAKIAAGSGSGGGGGKSTEESWTADLLATTFGPFLVGAIGLGIAAGGVYLIHRGWTEKFRKQLEAGAGGGHTGTAIIKLGKVGHLAKGVALIVVGGLFAAAAIKHDADQAGGLDDALKKLLEQPYGVVLLTVVGLGIGAFGLYTLGRARYLRRAS